MSNPNHLTPLSEDQQERLREILIDRGEDDVAELLGLSRIALLRGAAGLGVMRGTRSVIARGLDELSDEDEGDDEPDEDDDDAEDGSSDDHGDA